MIGSPRPKQRRSFLAIIAAGVILLPILAGQPSHAQQASSPAISGQPPEARTEAPGVKSAGTSTARDELERAQTVYYQEQANKIEHPHFFTDNAAIFAAMVTALVGFVTLGFTYHGTRRSQEDARRNQQDTQFYEALKRIGDTESPKVRASAAGLLSHISLQTPAGRSRFLSTTLDCLCEALLLEDNPVALDSVVNGLKGFAEVIPEDVTNKLVRVNKELQSQFHLAAAELCCHFEYSITDGHWPDESIIQAWGFLKGYNKQVAATLLYRQGPLNPEGIKADRKDNAELEAKERKQDRRAAVARLKAAGLRLVASVTVLENALSKVADNTVLRNIPLSGVFLPQVSMRNHDLRGVDLSRAQLTSSDFEGARLDGAKLTGASLERANLQRSILDNAVLENATLFGARLFQARADSADFTRADWWQADFTERLATQRTGSAKPPFDFELVQRLYNRWQRYLPADLSHEQIDQNVRELMRELAQRAVAAHTSDGQKAMLEK